MSSTLEQYVSDNDDIDAEPEATQRKRKISKKWEIEKKFENAEDAKEYIVNNKNWGFSYSNQTGEGQKDFYRCNLVKIKGEQCAAAKYLLFDSYSDQVSISSMLYTCIFCTKFWRQNIGKIGTQKC